MNLTIEGELERLFATEGKTMNKQTAEMTEQELQASERAKYEDIWRRPEYRQVNHGLEMWREHEAVFASEYLAMMRKVRRKPKSANQRARFLDIGCGNGRLVQFWVNQAVDGYGVDFASNSVDAALHEIADRFSNQCLWNLKFDERFDIAVCADVLEHIPPERVDQTIAAIAGACDFVIFKIANYPSVFLNKFLHLSLHEAQWWADTLSEHGEINRLTALERPGIEEYVFVFAANR